MVGRIPGVISGSSVGIQDKVSLDGTTLSEVIWKIPGRIGVISVSVSLPAETGRVYHLKYTNYPEADIDADTAVWWDAFASEAQSTSRIIALYGALSGIKVTRVSGDGTFVACVRGQ